MAKVTWETVVQPMAALAVAQLTGGGCCFGSSSGIGEAAAPTERRGLRGHRSALRWELGCRAVAPVHDDNNAGGSVSGEDVPTGNGSCC